MNYRPIPTIYCTAKKNTGTNIPFSSTVPIMVGQKFYQSERVSLTNTGINTSNMFDFLCIAQTLVATTINYYAKGESAFSEPA